MKEEDLAKTSREKGQSTPREEKDRARQVTSGVCSKTLASLALVCAVRTRVTVLGSVSQTARSPRGPPARSGLRGERWRTPPPISPLSKQTKNTNTNPFRGLLGKSPPHSLARTGGKRRKSELSQTNRVLKCQYTSCSRARDVFTASSGAYTLQTCKPLD